MKRSVQGFFIEPEDHPFLAILRDPLSAVSRKNRSRLIGLSGVAIFIWLADLLPSQVSALGISLSGADQRWIITFIWISIIYLSITFVVYAVVDYWCWLENLKYRLMKFVHTNEQGKVNLDEAIDDALSSTPTFWKAGHARLKVMMDEYIGGEIKGYSLIWRSSPIAAARLFLDLIAPLAVSLLAVGLLMSWHIPPSQPRHETTTLDQPSRVAPASDTRRPSNPARGAPENPRRR